MTFSLLCTFGKEVVFNFCEKLNWVEWVIWWFFKYFHASSSVDRQQFLNFVVKRWMSKRFKFFLFAMRTLVGVGANLLFGPRGGLRGPNHLGLLGPPVKFSGPLVGLLGLLGLPWNSKCEFFREWINLPTKVVTNCRHNQFYNIILLAEQKYWCLCLKVFLRNLFVGRL